MECIRLNHYTLKSLKSQRAQHFPEGRTFVGFAGIEGCFGDRHTKLPGVARGQGAAVPGVRSVAARNQPSRRRENKSYQVSIKTGKKWLMQSAPQTDCRRTLLGACASPARRAGRPIMSTLAGAGPRHARRPAKMGTSNGCTSCLVPGFQSALGGGPADSVQVSPQPQRHHCGTGPKLVS